MLQLWHCFPEKCARSGGTDFVVRVSNSLFRKNGRPCSQYSWKSSIYSYVL